MPKPEILDDVSLKKTLESLLFITDNPLSVEKLGKAAGVGDLARITEILGQIREEWESAGSPWQMMEVAEGFQMSTRPAYAPFIRKIFAERMTMRLSRAAHETLAIIAYRQPMTRAEIETVRGVDVIAALETLLEKNLIRVTGRRETVGRPIMYGTTVDFLRRFGLKSLEDLPPLESFTPVPEEPKGEIEVQELVAVTESEVPAAAEPPGVEPAVSSSEEAASGSIWETGTLPEESARETGS